MLQGYSIFTSDLSLRRYIVISVKEAFSTMGIHVGVTYPSDRAQTKEQVSF